MRKVIRSSAAFVALLGLGVLAGYRLGRSEKAESRAAPSNASGEAREARPAQLPAIAPETWNAAVAPPAAVPTATANQAPDPQPEANSKVDLSYADQRIYLQSEFSSQKADPGWATQAGRQLSDDFRRVETKDVQFRGVECRSSLCRVELTAATAEAAVEFMSTYVRQRTWKGPGMMSNDEANPDGTRRAVVFLGREGTELPYLE